MTTPQKAKGSQWERDVASYFREHGFPEVERRYGAGATEDKGDINGLPGFAIECKNVGKITLSTIIDEALVEAKNAKKMFGIAIIKRRRRPTKDGYVVLTLEQFIELLHWGPIV